MTSKQEKDPMGSIKDLLGDLLGDDADDLPAKARSPTGGVSRPAGVLQTQRSKRNLFDDDFYRKLAEEAELDNEGSDVSEVDPEALLESMKNMDDMDDDLLSSKRKPSSAPSQSRTSRAESSKPRDKNQTTQAAVVEEKKPSSAPAAPGRNNRAFHIMDDDDDDDDDDDEVPAAKQDDLDEPPDEEQPKNVPSGHRGKQQSFASAVSTKEEQATPAPEPKKHSELTFDVDEDDLMDAMGFSDTPKGRGTTGLILKKESETPQKARTRLDEILEIRTSPHLLERPPTGEKKDATPAEKRTQKSSAGKDSVFGDEDLTFGSYQPTLGSTPEGRTSRRHSVRFSTEDVSSTSPEWKPKSSTTSNVMSAEASARPSRTGSDWLGLKQDDAEEEKKAEPKKDPVGASDRLKPPVSPLHVGGKPPRVTSKYTEEPKAMSDNWLEGALSKKKALAEERQKRQEESLGLGEEIDLDTFLSKGNPTTTPHRVKEDSSVPPSRQQSPIPAPTPSAGTQHTHEPEQKPAVITTLPVQQVSLSTDNIQQLLLLQQQLAHSQIWGLGAPLEQSSLQKEKRDAEHQPGDITALQARIIQLEGQMWSLQLEKDQLQMLLDNVQQRHKHDTELMENTHRARVKLLEECAVQREARAHMENQELMERLEAVTKLAQQERAELQEQYQRRLAQTQQERDREVERLRELQRKSILEMKMDHDEQVQRLRKLKDEEVDAVTSASSQTRSLTVVIEQMEKFSLRLDDLSSRIESTHENTTQGLELGTRQRDEQLRVLQERLTQQQRDMVEERKQLKEIIAKMDTQLAEHQRQLEQERWRSTAEQAKAESALRSLEEEKRTMTHQLTIEREELERAKSALLEEQQSVMQRCAEERRKLAADWTHFHAQDKLHKEREMDREGHIISIVQEQAELKLQAKELKQNKEAIQKERENLEKLRDELDEERERLNAAALHLKHRAQEVESLSKLARERYEEGERALQEAQNVEAGHQARLRKIHTETERLRTQELSLQEERTRMTDYYREMDRMRHRIPIDHIPVPVDPVPMGFSPGFNSTPVLPPAQPSTSTAISQKVLATLTMLKYIAKKDQDFLDEEQLFLDSLKHSTGNSSLHT